MVKCCHVTCRAALDQAVKQGLIVKNPADACKTPTTHPREMQVLTPEEIRRLLTALLESSGAAWEQADGWICFRLSKDGAVWDMACRCLTGRMLAYGRLPLRAADRDEACRRCSQVHGQVIRGAMFLSEEGWPVFRTEAELPERANALYELTCGLTEREGVAVKRGVFGADMRIDQVCDGPVTIVLEIKPTA